MFSSFPPGLNQLQFPPSYYLASVKADLESAMCVCACEHVACETASSTCLLPLLGEKNSGILMVRCLKCISGSHPLSPAACQSCGTAPREEKKKKNRSMKSRSITAHCAHCFCVVYTFVSELMFFTIQELPGNAHWW